MSATFRDEEDEIGAFIAAGVAGVTWRGTSAGGLWPGPVRPPTAGGVPATALFLFILAREPPRQYSRGGASTGQLHQGVLRLYGRGQDPGGYATIGAMVRACAEYAHNTKPSGYVDLRLVSGPIRLPTNAPNEKPVVYCDLRFGYQES